jgi:hypothetical protein
VGGLAGSSARRAAVNSSPDNIPCEIRVAFMAIVSCIVRLSHFGTIVADEGTTCNDFMARRAS